MPGWGVFFFFFNMLEDVCVKYILCVHTSCCVFLLLDFNRKSLTLEFIHKVCWQFFSTVSQSRAILNKWWQNCVVAGFIFRIWADTMLLFSTPWFVLCRDLGWRCHPDVFTFVLIILCSIYTFNNHVIQFRMFKYNKLVNRPVARRHLVTSERLVYFYLQFIIKYEQAVSVNCLHNQITI